MCRRPRRKREKTPKYHSNPLLPRRLVPVAETTYFIARIGDNKQRPNRPNDTARTWLTVLDGRVARETCTIEPQPPIKNKIPETEHDTRRQKLPVAKPVRNWNAPKEHDDQTEKISFRAGRSMSLFDQHTARTRNTSAVSKCSAPRRRCLPGATCAFAPPANQPWLRSTAVDRQKPETTLLLAGSIRHPQTKRFSRNRKRMHEPDARECA